MKTPIHTTLIRSLFLTLLFIVITSCSSAPPKMQDLEVRISATADVNPDLENRPSPIILHMLELTDTDAFNRVDFFALTQDDTSALGGSVLNKTEIILTPGSSQASTLKLNPQTAFLGFVAGYRDIDNSSWRVSQAVVPGNTDWISVKLDSQKISVTETND
jgi:type VI secretion system protein VasD